MSPNLLACEDLELAVPGTYEPNQEVVHIKSVSPSLSVITSKQRPRKLVIQGLGVVDVSCQCAPAGIAMRILSS